MVSCDWNGGSFVFIRAVVLEIWDFDFSAFFSQNGYFSQFCKSDGYILYQTPIGKCTLRLKWVVTRLHTTSGSRDIEFEPFSAILAILRLAQRLVMSTRFFSLTLDPFYRFISGRQLINDFPTGPPARAWSIPIINHFDTLILQVQQYSPIRINQ